MCAQTICRNLVHILHFLESLKSVEVILKSNIYLAGVENLDFCDSS